MVDVNTKIRNRIYATRDLNTLWQKLRDEGFSVWQADDYIDNNAEPYHLYYIEKDYGVPVEVLYRDKTYDEIEQDKKLGLSSFIQEIEWIKY